MTAQIAGNSPAGNEAVRPERRQQLALFALLLLSGIAVFVVFSHFYPFYDRNRDSLGRIVLAGLFLLLALGARASERFRAYWLLPFSFFAALAAISIDRYLSLSKWLLPALNVAAASPAGWAIEKLESSLLGIIVVLALNRLAGQPVSALYIRRGNLRLGLGVGLVAFALMIATVIPVTETFFKGENLSWARILSWAPWVMLFVLSNASNEELLFRGQFIGRMQPFLGRLGANVVTTIPFVWMHASTGYATDISVFLAFQLLPLSLAWCWLMQKTGSIWGSILFHAAMDIPIVVGIFSTLR